MWSPTSFDSFYDNIFRYHKFSDEGNRVGQLMNPHRVHADDSIAILFMNATTKAERTEDNLDFDERPVHEEDNMEIWGAASPDHSLSVP